MKTSRLKNIVIVILLLVNAFLLFLLLSRRAEERDSNERRVEQLCTLFEKNGVAFDRALLPDEETHLTLSLERDAAREEAFASLRRLEVVEPVAADREALEAGYRAWVAEVERKIQNS